MLTQARAKPLARPVPSWRPLRAHRLRRQADRLLRAGMGSSSDTELISWRAAELTSDHERRVLVHSLHSVQRELDGSVLPSAAPIARAGLRPHAAWLHRLELRLSNPDAPVSPRGILLVHDLLTDADGPLYTRELAHEIPGRVRAILAALDEA
ncbi:MAG: hypothetical protein ACXWYS_02815 [Gaiellaceae bacterium]